MAAVLSVLLPLFTVLVAANDAPSPSGTGGIFSCRNARGEALTGDHELIGCVGDQIERNRDGSFRRVVPRPQTEDEKVAEEERKRRLEREATERRIEQRKDEGLLRLYPDVAALERARQSALAGTVAAMKVSDERTQELLKARKRLSDEAEFYVNKPLPPKLKNDLDASDAALAAQKQAQQNRQDELQRNNDNFDSILARLKMLWVRKPAAPK